MTTMMSRPDELTLPPHPRDAGPVIGSLPAFRVDMMQAFLDGWREHGDLVRYRGPRTMYVAAHPDYVGRVLEERADDYHRTRFAVDNLRPIMGDGLFISRGALWAGHRQLVEPAFASEHVTVFASHMAASTNAMLERWDASSTRMIDAATEMERLNLDILGLVLFGEDDRGKRAALAPAIVAATEYCIPKVMALANPPDAMRPGYRSFRSAMTTLERIVDGAISERRREPRSDLVSMLVGSRDRQSGRGLSDRELRDEILTAMFGAYKGLAHALTWTWSLLSGHPEVARRVTAEAVDALEGRAPTLQELSALPFTAAVVKESLRLHPPLWALPREARTDDEIGGYAIPKGVTVVLSPYITHRHPDFWEDPSGFDPERFLPGRDADRHPYAYFPFGTAPRSCVGEHYALLELTLVIATVAQRYKLSVVPSHRTKRRREFILRSINGMPTVLQSLDGNAPAHGATRT